MDTIYLIGCRRCKYYNTKHRGCNYDDFMRELGSSITHKVNDLLECSGFDEKIEDNLNKGGMKRRK